MGVYDFPFFKTVNDFGIDVRTATHCRSVTQHLSCFLDCCHHFSFSSRTLLDRLGPNARECAGTNYRTGPGAKIFGAESRTHNLLDVFVNVAIRNVDESAVTILIFKNFSSRIPEQGSHDFRDLAIF